MICLFKFQEPVGNFLADFYSVNGLVLESRKRREHLSEEDILRNKAIMESLSKGGNLIDQNFEVTVILVELLRVVLTSQCCNKKTNQQTKPSQWLSHHYLHCHMMDMFAIYSLGTFRTNSNLVNKINNY